MLSPVEVETVRRFDDHDLLHMMRDTLEEAPYKVVARMNALQLERIEACEKFFPPQELPTKKDNRRTANPVTRLREIIGNILNTYPTLRSCDTEKCTQKIELANQVIRERLGE
jgi:hypothetical protein